MTISNFFPCPKRFGLELSKRAGVVRGPGTMAPHADPVGICVFSAPGPCTSIGLAVVISGCRLHGKDASFRPRHRLHSELH